LDEDFGEDLSHSFHKLVHEFIHALIIDTLLTKTQVKRVFQVLGVVGTEL
jgi:hypothetical protein